MFVFSVWLRFSFDWIDQICRRRQRSPGKGVGIPAGMEVPWLLLVHGSVTALVVVSFLCGQWPIFEGTFIQSINHFLTFGAYHYLLYVLAPPFPLSFLSLLLLLSE